MDDNLPILYKNIMFGLPSDLARDVFLWASDRPNADHMQYKAEDFAREAHQIVETLRPMLDAGAAIHGMESHDPDLMNFILQRHANWRFGGNVAPEYCNPSPPMQPKK